MVKWSYKWQILFPNQSKSGIETEKKGHEKFMGMLDTIEIFNSVFQPIPKKKLLS